MAPYVGTLQSNRLCSMRTEVPHAKRQSGKKKKKRETLAQGKPILDSSVMAKYQFTCDSTDLNCA